MEQPACLNNTAFRVLGALVRRCLFEPRGALVASRPGISSAATESQAPNTVALKTTDPPQPASRCSHPDPGKASGEAEMVCMLRALRAPPFPSSVIPPRSSCSSCSFVARHADHRTAPTGPNAPWWAVCHTTCRTVGSQPAQFVHLCPTHPWAATLYTARAPPSCGLTHGSQRQSLSRNGGFPLLEHSFDDAFTNYTHLSQGTPL
jgi:hypothetical protein